MANLRFASRDTSHRLDSDREVLPFPAGGVFGSPNVTGPARTVRDIERTLDTMQRQLNELSDAVDEVLKFSDFVEDESDFIPTPPSAA
ncbi:MAG: hypothetical protein RLN60_00935 [Phycisphaerales bacterium]